MMLEEHVDVALQPRPCSPRALLLLQQQHALLLQHSHVLEQLLGSIVTPIHTYNTCNDILVRKACTLAVDRLLVPMSEP
jgi:hypothetical protein